MPPWRRNVGMVFQSYALWPHMTVRKNVAFGLEERKLAKTEINRRVDQALDLVGLSDLGDRRPSQLSGGQQQRIALARTVVVEPRILLLDEPLSNLDANLRVQMRRDILDLQRKLKLTTIFVTHDQEEANTVSDRMAVLDKGVIQQVGTPMQLYDRPANLFVAEFLGTANVIRGEAIERDNQAWFSGENGWSIKLPAGTTATGTGAVVFRPQNVVLSARDDVTAENDLTGQISYLEFLGSFLRYGVQVGGNRVLVDEYHRHGASPFEAGQVVKLSVDSSSLVFIRQ
jgi:iron(III) transport system ATP-binding protein